MNIEDRLKKHLQETAQITEPAPDPQRAVARHRQRQLRQRVGMGAAAIVAVTGAGTAIWAATDDEPKQASVATESIEPTDPDDPANSGPPTADTDGTILSATLDWRTEEGSLGSYETEYFEIDDLLYAISTAPGTRWEDFPDGKIPQSLYTSSDGLEWSEQARFDDPWISDLAPSGTNLLYAIGTAPAANGGIDAVFGVTDSGGENWTITLLPSNAVAPDASIPLEFTSREPLMATTGDTTVVTLRTIHYVDYRALIPVEFRPEGDNWSAWAVPDGVMVEDYSERAAAHEACYAVIGDAESKLYEDFDKALNESGVEPDYETLETELSSALDELRDGEPACEPAYYESTGTEEIPVGLEGDPVEMPADQSGVSMTLIPWGDLPASRPDEFDTNEMFLTGDGSTFETVAWPFDPTDKALSIKSAGDGFLALTWNSAATAEFNSASAWHSPDGRRWSRVTIPIEYATTAGAIGDAAVVVGDSYSDAGDVTISASRSTDGGASWISTDLTSHVAGFGTHHYVQAASVSDGGAAVVVTSSPNYEEFDASFEADPDTYDYPPEIQTLLRSADGINWVSTPLEGVLSSEMSWVSGVYIGRDGVTFLTTDRYDETLGASVTEIHIGSPAS